MSRPSRLRLVVQPADEPIDVTAWLEQYARTILRLEGINVHDQGKAA